MCLSLLHGLLLRCQLLAKCLLIVRQLLFIVHYTLHMYIIAEHENNMQLTTSQQRIAVKLSKICRTIDKQLRYNRHTPN